MTLKRCLRAMGNTLLVLAALAGLWSLSQFDLAPVEFVNKYTTSDVVYADGRTAHFDNKSFGRMDKGDTATLHIHLPETPIFPDASLMFYCYNAVTEVWFEDALLDSYGADIAQKGRMIGNRYFQIAIPHAAWGKEITIRVRATTNNAFSNFTNLRVFPSQYAYRYFMDVDPFGVICAVVLFVFALLGIFACVLGQLRGSVLANALCLVALMMLVSLWLIANEGLYTLLGASSYFWQPLEYMAGYTIAVPLLLFYRGMVNPKSKWRTVFGVAAGVNALFFIVATALHFTNALHYDAMMDLASALMIASGILLLLYSVLLKTHHSRARRMIRLGMFIFIPTCLYEVLYRALLRQLPFTSHIIYHPLIALGMLMFLLCQVCAFIMDLYDQQRALLTVQIKADTLDKVIAETPAGICQLKPDEDLTIISANQLFYEIIGFAMDGQPKPKSIFPHLLETEKPIIRQKVNEVLHAKETVGEFELSSVTPSNEPITVLIRYDYDRDGSGHITINIVDITRRKRAEEELRIREEDYRTAIEASDHYYFNYDAATKTCTHMFDSEELFGISEKVGNIPESLIELGLCAPESIEDYRAAFRSFAMGAPSGDLCLHLQNVKTHTYRWYGGSFRTVFDANGKPLHAIVAFKDITEQREKEIAYNIHKQQIEAHPEDEITYYELNITTGMCDYSYGLEAKRVLETAPPRWSEMLDVIKSRFVRAEDRQAVGDFLSCEHLLDLYRHGMTEAAHEYRGGTSGGDARWLRASVSITSDSRTREVRAYCSIEDIEAEKAAQLERQTEQQRSRYYEEAYEKLSSSVMYGVCKYAVGDDLTIVFANDIFYQMHGYQNREAAVAAGFTSVLFATPPFGRDMVRAAHREYTEGKARQLFETEYPSVDAQGNHIWVMCRGIYSSEEGMFNSSTLNITDRKNAEEQLRVSEERYRLALSQSGKVFFFFDVPTRTMRLSQELAEAFGLPMVVDNMPENFISQGLVEKESVDNYRQFYARIIAGERTGDTIISCHMRANPDQILWYRIAFTSVFDAQNAPQSAIITYEDLQEQREREIAGAWKQLNLLSVPPSRYVIAEYNLTHNRLLSQVGELFAKLPDFLTSYDEINAFVLEHFIFEEDVDNYRRFLDRQRILRLFDEGVSEDSTEYRSLQSGSAPRWTSTSIQMIRDPYSGDVLAQILFMDIHAERSDQIELAQNVEELKKELENSRIKVMINQMQPHFLYNALSAIRTIIKSDPDYAYSLIYDFTVHLRSSIKALSSDTPIPFAEELKNIKAYLNIEQMRFGDSLQVNYEIDCDHFSVVPLSIQPLAENAARHGVYPKGEEGGTVTVRTYETVTAYVVEVEDDGVGFDVAEVFNRESDSIGLKSLIFRLKSLMNADVVINSKLGAGTLVTVTIPKNETA